jgi:hypothetical protein
MLVHKGKEKTVKPSNTYVEQFKKYLYSTTHLQVETYMKE